MPRVEFPARVRIRVPRQALCVELARWRLRGKLTRGVDDAVRRPYRNETRSLLR